MYGIYYRTDRYAVVSGLNISSRLLNSPGFLIPYCAVYRIFFLLYISGGDGGCGLVS